MSYPQKFVSLASHGQYRKSYSPFDPWNGVQTSSINGSVKPYFTPFDLFKIFNHPQLSTISFFSYPDSNPYSLSNDKWHKSNPSSENFNEKEHPLKDLISFIIIYNNAHPNWNDKNEIWIHSKIDLIKKDFDSNKNGKKKNFNRPIPVFKAGKGKQPKFSFEGYMIMESFEIVLPKSEELRRMLQAKEDAKSYKTGRTAAAWEESLSYEWLKIKFAPVNKEYKDPAKMGKGEGAKYVLEIGGLKDELEILNDLEKVAGNQFE